MALTSWCRCTGLSIPKGKLALVGSASASPLALSPGTRASLAEASEVSAEEGRVEVANVVTRLEASGCVSLSIWYWRREACVGGERDLLFSMLLTFWYGGVDMVMFPLAALETGA